MSARGEHIHGRGMLIGQVFAELVCLEKWLFSNVEPRLWGDLAPRNRMKHLGHACKRLLLLERNILEHFFLKSDEDSSEEVLFTDCLLAQL